MREVPEQLLQGQRMLVQRLLPWCPPVGFELHGRLVGPVSESFGVQGALVDVLCWWMSCAVRAGSALSLEAIPGAGFLGGPERVAFLLPA